MLGLIKKDLLTVKSNCKILAILLIVYSLWALNGDVDLLFIMIFMSVMLMISTFSYDAYNKWDAYAVTIPNGREYCVKAKYLTTIFLTAIITIIVTIIGIAITYYNKNQIDFENIFSVMIGSIFATTLLQSLMYPVIYKFGVEKARIGIFIIIVGITIIAGFISRYIDSSVFKNLTEFMNDYLLIALPIIMILMLCISYKISQSIYNKKEF